MNRLGRRLIESPVQSGEKGFPGDVSDLPLEDIATQGWNLLSEDLPLPAAILKDGALRHNSYWMGQFLKLSNTAFAPHGKTTMCPALFDLQISDGAWAITVSTLHQLRVARRFGYSRLILANQLVGRKSIEWVLTEINSDPDFEFYCIIDSEANVRELARAARAIGLKRPVQLLVELGYQGGRTGCRSTLDAVALARLVGTFGDVLALSGIEAFEGLIREATEQQTVAKVEQLLDRVVELVTICAAEKLFAPGLVVLTAGGTGFFDIVASKLKAVRLEQESLVVLRSGCYLTHDAVIYTYMFNQMQLRSPRIADLGIGLIPALEIWAYVQSRPEPGKAIVALGKRDISYDHMPAPQSWFRPGGAGRAPQTVGQGYTVTKLDDQHCYVAVPEDSDWRVGDLIGFGISHPCLTFDKWRVLHVVDDDYTVIESVRTYF